MADFQGVDKNNILLTFHLFDDHFRQVKPVLKKCIKNTKINYSQRQKTSSYRLAKISDTQQRRFTSHCQSYSVSLVPLSDNILDAITVSLLFLFTFLSIFSFFFDKIKKTYQTQASLRVLVHNRSSFGFIDLRKTGNIAGLQQICNPK